MQRLEDLHGVVWAWRAEVEGYFPTPNRDDSLAFALTEVAEAFEAQLRSNEDYKRRDQKEHTEWRELTQCAMMLLTALGPTWRQLHTFADGGVDMSLWRIAQSVATAGAVLVDRDNERSMDLWVVQALNTIDRRLDRSHGMDLRRTLVDETARLGRKHAPVEVECHQ